MKVDDDMDNNSSNDINDFTNETNEQGDFYQENGFSEYQSNNSIKKIAIIGGAVLGGLIIILIIVFLVSGKAKLTDVSVDDVYTIYVGENTEINIKAVGKGNLSKTNYKLSTNNKELISFSESELNGDNVKANVFAKDIGKTSMTITASNGKNTKIVNKNLLICRKLSSIEKLSDLYLGVGKANVLNELALGYDDICFKDITYKSSDESVVRVEYTKFI